VLGGRYEVADLPEADRHHVSFCSSNAGTENMEDKIAAFLRSRGCFTTEQHGGRFDRPVKAFYNSSEMVVSENTKTVFKYLNFPMPG
jgi:hypothetical protein